MIVSTASPSIKIPQPSSVPRYLRSCTLHYEFGRRRQSSTISQHDSKLNLEHGWTFGR